MNLIFSILLSVLFTFAPPKGDTVEKKQRDILFIGDSITETDKKTKTYAHRIKESNPKLKIDIIAHTGRKTEWMKTMLEYTLKSIHYDRVYIYGGINDMVSDDDMVSAINNIQAMVHLINDNGGIPIVIVGSDSHLILESGSHKSHKWIKSKDLDQMYSQYQKKLESHIRGAIILPTVKLDLDDMYTDGIHPNNKGHKKIKGYISESLRWDRNHYLYVPYIITVVRIPLHIDWSPIIPLPKFVQIDTMMYVTNKGFRYGYNIYEFEFWEWRKSIWKKWRG